MEELVAAAKSQHSIEKQIREIGGRGSSFVTSTDPNHSHTGGGPGDVFVKSAAYQKIAGPGRPRAVVVHGAGRGFVGARC